MMFVRGLTPRATFPALALVPLLALVGCEPVDTGPTDDTGRPAPENCTDDDRDGYCVDDAIAPDCDDADPDINPGAVERCNGEDDNCNGSVDESLPDADQDGVCDRRDTEECDGLDNDGDGQVDEGFDLNNNGTPDCEESEQCDGVDNNADGVIDEGFDVDGDGFTACGDVFGDDADCDDGDSAIFPGATESLSDAVDNDCDGLIDEGTWAAGDLVIEEVMANPRNVSDRNGEWFEVRNASGRTIYLNGLTIRSAGNPAHLIDSPELLAVDDGELFVLASNVRSEENGGVEAVYGYGLTEDSGRRIVLGNELDDLSLVAVDFVGEDVQTTVLDRVAWDIETVPFDQGYSLSLDPTVVGAESNDELAAWCMVDETWDDASDFGTPNDDNPICLTYDHDGDGQTIAEGDCDDDDPDIYLGAPETDPTVDNDCDGAAEQGPTAVTAVGSTSGDKVCNVFVLDGTGSSDPQGDTSLTYAWTLTSKPSTSTRTTADILFADTAEAEFTPDVDGSYTFDLVVTDSGDAASDPESLTITAGTRSSNSAPTARGGDNQKSEGEVKCAPLYQGGPTVCGSCADTTFTLDGSGSTDPDNDGLSYKWTVISGKGQVLDPGATTPRVEVAGPTPAAKGQSAVETVFISLQVTDCMGSTSSLDTVAVSYTCNTK